MKSRQIVVSFGDVRNKRIVTDNHFISHMIEHIAWRMGLCIDLFWKGHDWEELGVQFGLEISKFTPHSNGSAALGMIDDGSAAVSIERGQSDLQLTAVAGVTTNWFLGLRCEQLINGEPLLELLKGLARGLTAKISVEIWTVEDPHHTWEGIFRGVGICLNQIYAPQDSNDHLKSLIAADVTVQKLKHGGEVEILEKGAQCAKVRRGTAETGVVVGVDLSAAPQVIVKMSVDPSLDHPTKELEDILLVLAHSLRARISIDFQALSLSSSHVVMEDIGLVMGRALLEILRIRMEKYGVNSAGSSLQRIEDLQRKNVRVGLNIEGRKFWRFVPADGDFTKLRKNFLIGQNVFEGLRSEDLDDFIDGLAGGLSASIMIHVPDYTIPELAWKQVFQEVGVALHEAFTANPYRVGVPAGVKATLA